MQWLVFGGDVTAAASARRVLAPFAATGVRAESGP